MHILPCSLRPVIGPKEHYITDVTVVGYKKLHNNYVGSHHSFSLASSSSSLPSSCKHQPPTHTHPLLPQVYIIHITWSDRYRYEIYRRYGEFFTFQVCHHVKHLVSACHKLQLLLTSTPHTHIQNTLQQLFPLESGKLKSSERILPSLPSVFHGYFPPLHNDSGSYAFLFCPNLLLSSLPLLSSFPLLSSHIRSLSPSPSCLLLPLLSFLLSFSSPPVFLFSHSPPSSFSFFPPFPLFHPL